MHDRPMSNEGPPRSPGVTVSRTIRFMILALTLLCTTGCDQVTKHLARTKLTQTHFGAQTGRFIEFILAENPGAFLSLGGSFPQATRKALTYGIGLGLALILSYLIRNKLLPTVAFVGLALAWSGGVSNLIDRFARDGLVTDFLVVRIGPLHTGIFNLADIAIVAGLLLAGATLLNTRAPIEPDVGGKGSEG